MECSRNVQDIGKNGDVVEEKREVRIDNGTLELSDSEKKYGSVTMKCY